MRLVAQNYLDENVKTVETRLPTVHRSSQRPIMYLTASLNGMKTFFRDITQANIKRKHYPEREVYIFAPTAMGYPEGTSLNDVRPIYGITESGLNWVLTYLEHHETRIGI